MVLYFSGSGNSLAIARHIAKTIDDKTMPLRKAVAKDLTSEKRIGLVYPTYLRDAPIAVKELVPQLQIAPSAYVFIVITCGRSTNNSVWTVGTSYSSQKGREGSLLPQNLYARQPCHCFRTQSQRLSVGRRALCSTFF